MSKLITPPASRSGSETSPIETKPAATLQTASELRLRLDTLLEQYLDLLNKQQQLQSGLAKHMSLGFLSLAQANYSSPPGRHYGADYYDERMKATRTISIRIGPETEGGSRVPNDHGDDMSGDNLGDVDYQFTLEHISRHMSDQQPRVKPPMAKGLRTHVSRLETHVPSNETDSGASHEDPDSHELPLEGTSERLQKPPSDDPLHWYGVLVPFALRTTQRAFAEGIRDQVPELATVAMKMRTLERRITRLRVRLAREVDARGEP